MKALLFALVFAPVVAFASGMISGVLGELPPVPAQDAVEFAAGFDSDITQHTGKKEKWPVSVYCRWRNISKSTQRILVKDHDSYHGTLDYPWGIKVRVTDKNGRRVSATKSSPDGWYDSSGLMSQFSRLMPGDIIELKPGEEVTRSFSVEDVLSGLTFFQTADEAPVVDGVVDMTKSRVPSFSYPAGRCTIEVRFFSVQAKNPMILLVEEKGEQATTGNDGEASHSSTEPGARRP